MSDDWHVVSQMGIPGEGTIYGIRFRSGYTVMGFQREDAEAIVRQAAEIKRLEEAFLKVEAFYLYTLDPKPYDDPLGWMIKLPEARAALERIKEGKG